MFLYVPYLLQVLYQNSCIGVMPGIAFWKLYIMFETKFWEGITVLHH
jgi:hypothetical protein